MARLAHQLGEFARHLETHAIHFRIHDPWWDSFWVAILVIMQRSHHIPLAIKTFQTDKLFTHKHTGLEPSKIIDICKCPCQPNNYGLEDHRSVQFWLPNPRHLPAMAMKFCHQPLPRALLLEQVAPAVSSVSQDNLPAWWCRCWASIDV